MLCSPLRILVDYFSDTYELREFSKLAKLPRESEYFARLMHLFNRSTSYPLAFCIWYPLSLRADFALLQKLQNAAVCKQTDLIKQVAVKAIQVGFAPHLLAQIVGNSIDVEILDEKGQREKFSRYILQHDHECAVCFDQFSPEDFLDERIHRTVCAHYFHYECLKRWTNKKSDCPSCRHAVVLTAEHAMWSRYLESIRQAIADHFLT